MKQSATQNNAFKAKNANTIEARNANTVKVKKTKKKTMKIKHNETNLNESVTLNHTDIESERIKMGFKMSEWV